MTMTIARALELAKHDAELGCLSEHSRALQELSRYIGSLEQVVTLRHAGIGARPTHQEMQEMREANFAEWDEKEISQQERLAFFTGFNRGALAIIDRMRGVK